MASIIAAEALALQRLYHWERNAPERVALSQPLGGGVVRDYTWRELLEPVSYTHLTLPTIYSV